METDKYLEDIISFANKWIDIFSNPKSTAYDLCDNVEFGDTCVKFGFILDNGESFKNTYKVDSYEEVVEILTKVTNLKILGSTLFSYWRYFNHWAYTIHEIMDKKDWFIKTLEKLKQLALEKQSK